MQAFKRLGLSLAAGTVLAMGMGNAFCRSDG